MARPDSKRAKQADHLDRLGDPGSVVVGPGRDVPGVQVPANHDDLLREFGAADLADDVVGLRIRENAGVDLHPDLDSCPCLQGGAQSICRHRAEGGRRDSRLVRSEAGETRVGDIVRAMRQ